LADFNEAIRLDPEASMAYNNRAVIWSQRRDYHRALADLSKAIQFDPQNDLAYTGRAWIWATCPDAKYRDGRRAVESATRSCEITEWKGADSLNTLAADKTKPVNSLRP
jgi:tetratricopeptide (TPR) repeat protein